MNPEIILGPPGTGKTTRLLGIVEDELGRGVSPDRVGFVSFTRKAAEEARGRAKKRFNLNDRQLPWFRTLHSLCFAALGLSNSEVFEGKKLREFGDWIGVSVSGKMSAEEGTTFGFDTGDRCLFMDNLARVRQISLRQQYSEDSDDLPWNLVERVSSGLAAFKKAHALHDFTDMLAAFAASDYRAHLEVLVVDEAQDLSALQWRVVEKLARDARRVVIAGDDDQAIYRWAGAAVEHFVALPGQESVLGQSWRVPPAVQKTSLELLGRIGNRREKLWRPREGEEGSVVRVPSLDVLDFQQDHDTLILARNTCFLNDDAMPLLRQRGIVYSFRGATSVRQSVLSAVLGWEKLRRGEKISVAEAEKIYQLMEVGVGFARGHKKLPHWSDRDEEVGMEDLRQAGGLLTTAIWHEALTRISVDELRYMIKALEHGSKLTSEPKTRVSTIHGSKGGQADHVILLVDLAQRTYREARERPDDEARCWYVAATRAKSRLTIVAPQTRTDRFYNI